MTISDPDGISLVVGATGRHGGTGGTPVARCAARADPGRLALFLGC